MKERKKKKGREKKLTGTDGTYPLGAVLLAGCQKVERVFLAGLPISHLERQPRWYTTPASACSCLAACHVAADAADAAGVTPEARRFNHVDALDRDSTSLLAPLRTERTTT